MAHVTDTELRKAFPAMTHWQRKLWQAFARGAAVNIGSPIPREDFDAAVLYKLTGDAWPWKPREWKPPQSLGAAATSALERAIRPRRTGQRRGRRALHLDRVMVDIAACFEGRRYYDVDRLRTVVLHHLGPMTIGQRVAVLLDLEVVTERQGRRVDWRAWLKRWRQTLRKSDAK